MSLSTEKVGLMKEVGMLNDLMAVVEYCLAQGEGRLGVEDEHVADCERERQAGTVVVLFG